MTLTSLRWLATALAIAFVLQQSTLAAPPNPDDAVLRSATFDQATADVLLQRIADGMHSHNLARTRSAFDLHKFPAAFADNMAAAFDHYESFHLFYRVQQATQEENKGIVVADLTLESLPRANDSAPIRKHFLLRVEMARVPIAGGRSHDHDNEWRIVALDPVGALFSF